MLGTIFLGTVYSILINIKCYKLHASENVVYDTTQIKLT